MIQSAAIATVCCLLLASCSTGSDSSASTPEPEPSSTTVDSESLTTGAPTTTAPATTSSTTTPTTADDDSDGRKPNTTEALPAGQPPPAPSTPGKYGVGRQTLTVFDPSRDRTIPVDVWYPTAPNLSGDLARYEFILGIELESAIAIDGAKLSTDGGFPLVVYSHGSSGQSYIATFLTETLASHGFVVAAPNHVGNTAIDAALGTTDSLQDSAYDRPLDTSQTITAVFEAAADTQSELFGSVDSTRVGIAGHSFGGFTAFAAVAGLPQTSHPATPPDERIDAIAAMAPATSQLPDELLSSITVPMMVITGTDDKNTPIDPESTRPFDLVSSAYAYRIDLARAGHQSFTDLCGYIDEIPLLQYVDAGDALDVDGCQSGQMPIDRAHELTNEYVIAFLQAHVADNSSYRLLLTPDAAAMNSDVEFFVR